jgi:hypothetical protein
LGTSLIVLLIPFGIGNSLYVLWFISLSFFMFDKYEFHSFLHMTMMTMIVKSVKFISIIGHLQIGHFWFGQQFSLYCHCFLSFKQFLSMPLYGIQFFVCLNH